MKPKVSFVVPCYNLAHLLPECINSILDQTYDNLEILIMDDCSPDDTLQVAKSFSDHRVKYVRNEKNLKHLANYNKGINLAQGKYVWLISADDRLRKSYVLEKYVEIMDRHQEVGYVFCPAMALRNGEETGVEQWTVPYESDRIMKGQEFFLRLIQSNCVAAASGMVRRDCYKIEQFALDLPYAGDWYLWCLFALHYDVAYVAEPMVHYRLHEKSYTSIFSSDDMNVIITDEIKVRWRIMDRAEVKGCKALAVEVIKSIVNEYVNRIGMKEIQKHRFGITYNEFENSLARQTVSEDLKKYIRSVVLYGMANNYYVLGNTQKALTLYKKAINERKGMWKVLIKYLYVLLKRRAYSKVDHYSIPGTKNPTKMP